MRISTWLVVGGLVVGAAVAAAQPAKAAAKAPAKAPAKGPDFAPQIAAVSSNDVEAAARAATELGDLGDPAAHDALLDALAMGLAPAVAAPALAALAVHPAPPDVAALVRYAKHRTPVVRDAALAALAMYPDPAAHAAIVTGLHDAAGMVRGAAAAAAAKAHVHAAIEPTLALLARGEEPAARALAQMADAELARKLADQLGQVPDPLLARCLGGVLKRADFGPDPARVEVVRAIAKIGDSAAVDALTEYLEASPKAPPRPSRAEAQKIIEARGGK